MPRNCGCASGTCSCQLVSTDGTIRISGSGSATNPYDLSAGNISLAGRLLAQNTSTVDLNLEGEGTQSDPFILTAESTLSLGELEDVDTENTTVGHVVARQEDGSFALDPPSTAEVGEINSDDSLTGDGSAGDPLAVTDYENIAWLEGSDNSPNDQSLAIGELDNETVRSFLVNREAPDGYDHSDSTAEMRLYNAGQYQQASLALYHDGAEQSRLNLGPGDRLHMRIDDGGVQLPLPTRIYATTVDVTISGGNSEEFEVPFPSGRFTSAPAVAVSISGAPNDEAPDEGYAVYAYDVSTSSAWVQFWRIDGSSLLGVTFTVSVIAMEEE